MLTRNDGIVPSWISSGRGHPLGASVRAMQLTLRRLRRADEPQFVPAWGLLEHAYYQRGMEFSAYLARLADVEAGRHLPRGHVPNTQLYADVAGTLVGRLSIRHELNRALETIGGHIGYAVLATHRRRGYGTEMLRQALPIARDIGLARVLITCDETNTASRKVIEANGGIYQDRYKKGLKVAKLRYWIELAEGHK